MAPVIRGNSLYMIAPGPSWNNALASSIGQGGNLVRIDDEDEQTFLYQTYQGVRSFDFNTFWIGLYKEGGKWFWSSEPGVPLKYENWGPSRPDPSGSGPNPNHAVMFSAHGGGWDDHDQNDIWWNNPRGIAEIPLNSSITFSTTPKEGAGVFTTSINLSAGTKASGNLAEGATLYWKVTGVDADDLASGELSGSGTITNGKLDLEHSLKSDSDTGESFEISIFSDADKTQQIGAQQSEVITESLALGEIESDRAIKFTYTLYEADGTTLASEGLSVASWGSEHDKGRQYVLAFEAESLYGDTITIDDLDITLDFNNSIFEALSANDVQITSDLPLANSALINNADGLIRIAAGSADALGRTTGSGIGNKAEVVRLLVNVKDSAFVGDGLHTNDLVPLDAGIQVSANLDETVFSDLTTLRDQGGINAYATSSSPLNISRANTELTVTGDENTLHLGTQRSIGGASTTNLIRRGDIVANHQVNWRNTGDAAATGLTIDASSNLNSNVAMVVSANGVSSVPDGSIAIGDLTIQRELSGTITDRDQVVVDFSYTATGAAGSVIDLGNAKYTVSANGGYSWESSNASTKNLITYQGDLNYDGRVSMLDLAYLNAGAAQAQVKGTVAHDVDADFNGQIDISDLSILDADWGQSLHTGADSFLGSNMISMQDLLQQGDASWSDTAFRDQNVVEASPDFIPTLDEPGVLAVIDGDGQSPSTPDIQGAALQDALIPA